VHIRARGLCLGTDWRGGLKLGVDVDRPFQLTITIPTPEIRIHEHFLTVSTEFGVNVHFWRSFLLVNFSIGCTGTGR